MGGFLGEFFWECFLGGIFGGNSTKRVLNIEEIDLFVKILDLRKGRRKFKSLDYKYIALKKNPCSLANFK